MWVSPSGTLLRKQLRKFAILLKACLEMLHHGFPRLTLTARSYVDAHGILKYFLKVSALLLGKPTQGSQKFCVNLGGELLALCRHCVLAFDTLYLDGGGYVGVLSYGSPPVRVKKPVVWLKPESLA